MNQFSLSQLVGQLLGNQQIIAYSPAIARAIGDAEATIFLCQACHWQSIVGSGNWFYKLRDAQKDSHGRMLPPTNAHQQSWEFETSLSRTRQETARKKLRRLGLLEECLKGVPARMHYRVSLERLAEFLTDHQQLGGFLPSSWQESSQLEGGMPAIQSEGILPTSNTKITSKITSKISSTTTTTRPVDLLQTFNLIFEPSVACHSNLLLKLFREKDVQEESWVQDIVDEFAGVVEAEAKGKHPVGVKNIRSWVLYMIKRCQAGDFDINFGRTVKDRRIRKEKRKEETSPPKTSPPTIRNLASAEVHMNEIRHLLGTRPRNKKSKALAGENLNGTPPAS